MMDSKDKQALSYTVIDTGKEQLDWLTNRSLRPLLIGCSGGGGHNFAIQSFERFFEEQQLSIYCPIKTIDKPFSFLGITTNIAANLSQFGYFKNSMQSLGLPLIPDATAISEEIRRLDINESRKYIDMLLDVYSTGHQSAAIWNILQRQDKKTELVKLIQYQDQHDFIHYNDVFEYYYNLLTTAYQKKEPYTVIICTQAMGLSALCSAVEIYNTDYDQKIVIHQFLTDIASKGAVHFFLSLSRLSVQQQKLMNLYAVGMEYNVLKHFFPQNCYFKGIYRINPKNNPMIRQGFINPNNDNSENFYAACTIDSTGTSYLTIDDNERIATIMLGSQASTDSKRYIDMLLRNGIDRVFVFGSSNPSIQEKIKQLCETYPSYCPKINLINQRDDNFIARLMTRSQILIIRAGGLSVMEQLAMNHHPQQIIMIHQADIDSNQHSSGIAWEDRNADLLIETLTVLGLSIFKVSPIDAEIILENHRGNILSKVNIDSSTDHANTYESPHLSTKSTSCESSQSSNIVISTIEDDTMVLVESTKNNDLEENEENKENGMVSWTMVN